MGEEVVPPALPNAERRMLVERPPFCVGMSAGAHFGCNQASPALARSPFPRTHMEYLLPSPPSKRMRTRLAPLPVFPHVLRPPSGGGKYLLLIFLSFVRKRNIEYCYRGFKTHFWDFIYNRFKNLPFPRKTGFTRRRGEREEGPFLRVLRASARENLFLHRPPFFEKWIAGTKAGRRMEWEVSI